jgi:hypothetical protein
MMRRNREIVIFNLSAIDLFCSGMGAVMVLMVLLMPYYRKQDPVPPPKPEESTPVVIAPPQPPAPLPAPVPPSPEPTKPEQEKAVQIRGVDVVFVIDATGSMEEELGAVRSGMASIVQVLRRLSDEVNVGFAAYVDRSVPWVAPIKKVTRDAEGEENLRLLLKQLSEIRLVGNEDWPEDVCGGLSKAAMMEWPEVGERRQIIVLIGDARTHPENHQKSLKIAESWVNDGAQSRSVHAVFTPPLDLVNQPGFDQEMALSKAYFMELAKAGKGDFYLGQDDLLGRILDILIVR